MRFAGFRDRRHAGRLLATRLRAYANRDDVLVFGLPRGGVPVAFEIARVLRAPLDVLLVRKLGVIGHEELAMGAIASGGARVLNAGVIATLGIAADEVERVVEREQGELERREALYRSGRSFPAITGKAAIAVDDGLATGATMAAAVEALRAHEPARVVVAAPVGHPDTCAALAARADEVVVYAMPPNLGGVGAWYERFDQTTDDEVRSLLAAAPRPS